MNENINKQMKDKENAKMKDLITIDFAAFCTTGIPVAPGNMLFTMFTKVSVLFSSITIFFGYISILSKPSLEKYLSL